MNYMLPLYLDYLERPDIYETLYLKEENRAAPLYKKKPAVPNMKLQRTGKLPSAKKVIKKAAKKQWSPQQVHAGKTAAKGSEFATPIKTTAKKVAGKSSIKGMAGKAAIGAAAAYGGYKLYKRYMSKAAKKCRGLSGDEKTLCLRQNARPS